MCMHVEACRLLAAAASVATCSTSYDLHGVYSTMHLESCVRSLHVRFFDVHAHVCMGCMLACCMHSESGCLELLPWTPLLCLALRSCSGVAFRCVCSVLPTSIANQLATTQACMHRLLGCEWIPAHPTPPTKSIEQQWTHGTQDNSPFKPNLRNPPNHRLTAGQGKIPPFQVASTAGSTPVIWEMPAPAARRATA